MKRSLLFAALLGCTMLTPQPAQAAPVVAWVAGALTVAGGTALAATAAYAAGATFAASVVGGFIVKTVVAIGLSALAAQLAPKPTSPPPSVQMANFAQPVTYAEWVYGRTRKGGFLGFTGFANDRRYYVPILAAHPIKGVVQHWLDERLVTLSGEADQNKSNITETPIAGYGRIDTFDGAPGQQVDPGLNAAFVEVTDAFDFAGLSGAVVWAARPPASSFTQIYPESRQWAYAPVIEGKNDLFDPRDGSHKFSSNAALVLADWVVNILGRAVDWDEVADEAEACGAQVLNAEGYLQNRWELNGALSDEQDFEGQRVSLAAACDAFLYERTDGKVGFTVGRWMEPDLVLGPDDFLSLELASGEFGADAPDEVAGVYTEPDNGWRETPSGTWVENAVAKPSRDEPQLFMVTNHNQISRLNKRLARTKLARYQITATIGFKGYEILGGRDGGRAHRFFRVVHPELQIDAFFEVGELTREASGLFTLTANSVSPEDFAFDAAAEEPARPVYDSVEGDNGIPVPGMWVISQGSSGSASLHWGDQSPAYIQELRYQLTAASSPWAHVMPAEGETTHVLSGLTGGAGYAVQIRNRSTGLGLSDWSDPVTFTA
ncbi:fibronectin type III domain-containing protein [Pseudophaeobacter sp. TrK17]|uniref:fibronectin type III domain-containing protein n=1 Tax=Pseudophaeobacter sp. TrK17 TaxID=2815167 RepID=UPI0035D13771